MIMVRFHVIFWLLHTAYTFFVVYTRFPSFDRLDFILSQMLLVFAFYSSVFCLKRTRGKNLFIIIGAAVTNFLLLCLLKYVHRYIFLPSIGHMRFYEPFEVKDFVNGALFNFLEFFLYAIGYWFTRKAFFAEHKLRVSQTEVLHLRNDKLALENEKIKLEYNYLKSQINPHFLYNTLNFFYAETMVDAPKAARGISILSQIMRYSLKQSESDGRVSLEDEVLHLNNYLALQKMRFDDDLKLNCSLPINIPPGYRILPHLLLTLAENAFKHGEAGGPMSITLDIPDGGLKYTVSNAIRMGCTVNDGGMGLQNMQNRLALYYGSNARLDFAEEAAMFVATLAIKHITTPEIVSTPIAEKTN